MPSQFSELGNSCGDDHESDGYISVKRFYFKLREVFPFISHINLIIHKIPISIPKSVICAVPNEGFANLAIMCDHHSF